MPSSVGTFEVTTKVAVKHSPVTERRFGLDEASIQRHTAGRYRGSVVKDKRMRAAVNNPKATRKSDNAVMNGGRGFRNNIVLHLRSMGPPPKRTCFLNGYGFTYRAGERSQRFVVVTASPASSRFVSIGTQTMPLVGLTLHDTT